MNADTKKNSSNGPQPQHESDKTQNPNDMVENFITKKIRSNTNSSGGTPAQTRHGGLEPISTTPIERAPISTTPKSHSNLESPSPPKSTSPVDLTSPASTNFLRELPQNPQKNYSMINHLISSSNKKSQQSKTIRNLLLKEIFPIITDQTEMLKIFGKTKKIVFLFILKDKDMERLGLVFDDFLLDNL
jgi:hypothetical protein